MSIFGNPFDPETGAGCACRRHASRAEHARDPGFAPAAGAGAALDQTTEQRRYENVVASAVLRAVFPKTATRRAFLHSVGASTAIAALSQFFPLKTATLALADSAPLEKTKLKIGFIPITCATPIIMAEPMGFYSKHGLAVEVVKTAGWAVIRDKTLNKEYDASHMLAAMPIAISLGLGSQPIPFTVPAIENINGQGITLAMKH
jgi:nitrate/nitrite transport system substrate-binding protein